MNRLSKKLFGHIAILVAVIAVAGRGDATLAQENSVEEPFVIEFYYKVQWGHFSEFYDLYRKNHYPILKRLQEMGRISEMNAVFPINHAGEADRWDMRFTIVYPNVTIAHEDFDTSDIIGELYPDKDLFEKEEQRRFELLIEHKDVPVWVNDLSEWTDE